MQYRILGKTGFNISEISLGTWQVGGKWGSGFDDKLAESILEKAIDARQKELPELKGFILPGGHLTAAWSHLARTVCRRAERHLVFLLEKSFQSDIPDQYRNAQIYLNRLSDYLFVIARYCNHLSGTSEKLWKK